MIATDRENKKTVALQTLPGRSATLEAVANFLHYKLDGKFVISPARISVLEPLHSASGRLAEILKQAGAADVDAVFFGYSSNLEKVVTSMGGRRTVEMDKPDIFARVFEVGGKKILSIPVTPYAFGDRASEVLQGLEQALPKKRLVVAVGIAGTLKPEFEVDSYVIPRVMRHQDQTVAFKNLAMDVALPGHRNLQAESVDSILQETRSWYNRAISKGASLVEQEGYDLVTTAQKLGYPVAAVYRISDRVGMGVDDFNTIEFSYQPNERLTNWQKAMVDLLLFGPIVE
jgi:hypothetical protein